MDSKTDGFLKQTSGLQSSNSTTGWCCLTTNEWESKNEGAIPGLLTGQQPPDFSIMSSSHQKRNTEHRNQMIKFEFIYYNLKNILFTFYFALHEIYSVTRKVLDF